MTMTQVKFAIPKGSIEEATFKILERSWTRVVRRDRTYRVILDDPQISVKMLRPQEIPSLTTSLCTTDPLSHSGVRFGDKQ
jgi:ATP phosphoribosyltransferase